MTERTGWVGPLLLLFLAIAACLSVFAINGGILFYYDSPDYFWRGWNYLHQVGLAPDPQNFMPPPPDTAGQGGTVGLPGEDDGVADASRSAVYAVVVAVITLLTRIEVMVFLQAAVVLLALWLVVHVTTRRVLPASVAVMVLALVLLAGAAGALPFYVAYLMPDILAAVLILMVALLVAAAPEMRGWELVLAFLLGALATLCHPSHMLISACLLPVTIIAVFLRPGPRRWLAPVLTAGMLAAALAAQMAFSMLAVQTGKSGVSIYPFLTARMIADGPGLAYLEESCTDDGAQAAMPECALYDALQKSDNPRRLRAPTIVFDKSEELGSFQHLPAETRLAISAGQGDFVVDVVKERPLDVVAAVIGNTWFQATLNRVDMTLQDDNIVDRVTVGPWYSGEVPGHGRLTANTDWLSVVKPIHNVVYVLSLGAVAVLILWPGLLPATMRLFLAMVLVGIAANAFVCGAVSVPAPRYGARVAWLLPSMAMLGVCLSWHWRRVTRPAMPVASRA